MRLKSRFAIIGALVGALLTFLMIMPVLASDSATTITGTGGIKVSVGVYAGNLVTGTKQNDSGNLDSNVLSIDTRLATALSDASASPFLIEAATTNNDARDTKVFNTIYVAGATKAYDQVLVSVLSPGLGSNGPGNDTITVSVKNLTTGSKVKGGTTSGSAFHGTIADGTLVLSEASALGTENLFQGVFFVTTLGTRHTSVYSDVAATDGQVIRVEYATAGVIIDLTVDAKGPTISGVGPSDKVIQSTQSAVFSGTITDSGSGLRTDSSGEDIGNDGTDSPSSDRDGDGVSSAEPLSSTAGATTDIGVNIGTGAVTSTGVTGDASDSSGLASIGWTAVTDGFSFTFTKSGLTANADTYWAINAVDRVNNAAKTDADGPATANNAFKITVDTLDPKIGSAETGIGWDAAKKKEKVDRNSIKVVFTAAGAGPATTTFDSLDSGTLGLDDFRVEVSSKDSTIVALSSFVHPNLKFKENTGPTNLVGDPIETRNVVYLQLENALSASAKPLVNLIGNIKDLAQNPPAPHSKAATDKITPGITLTVTGQASSRAVAFGQTVGTSNGKVKIRVVTDEKLGTPPTLRLLDATSNVDVVKVNAISAAITMSAVSGLDNTWENSVSATGVNLPGLVIIHVVGTDANANVGATAGITTYANTATKVPTALTGGSPETTGDALDLKKASDAGALLEFDNAIAKGSGDATSGFKLTPNLGGSSTTTTESSSPFIRINFAETQEYLTSGVTADKRSFGSPAVSVEVDSHNSVTLTSVLLDGVDVSGAVGTIGVDGTDYGFVLATSGLAVGTHTLAVNAVDEVGNTFTADQKFVFEVKARAAYSVPLSPGWNLISLPGMAADPAIDAVLDADHPATEVWTFDQGAAAGPWLISRRSAGEVWSGDVTEIVPGRGYWILTGSFNALKTLIPERAAAATFPTYAVAAGWNLVGVDDASQTKVGAVGSTSSADTYLASISWTVAYSYSTQANTWTKLTPKSTPVSVAANGSGYWVWATKAGTLAP